MREMGCTPENLLLASKQQVFEDTRKLSPLPSFEKQERITNSFPMSFTKRDSLGASSIFESLTQNN
ncbi:hypothetical protein JHK85_042778 [Glycine max]|nr:hypothetical protein JHK85_042778 [Glycine max]